MDVGCGSGYLCAAFYEMVKDSNKSLKVVGIEHIDALAQHSFENLKKSYKAQLDSGEIKIVVGDGRLGWV